jgi:hypothetical protein
MELLRLDAPLEPGTGDAVLVLAMDGWTDAGLGGTAAAEALREAFAPQRLGHFDGDALYDYRDRRPSLALDRGILGQPEWPELTVERLDPPAGPPLILVTGAEPDLGWQALGRDLVGLAEAVGAKRYVGLGSVPGPIPHTRPVQLICTASDPELAERIGRPHEQVVVPASCQVAMEALLRDAGLTTVGLWVRIPHYVAGEYPEASRALLEQLSAYLGTPVDLTAFQAPIAEHRAKLDVAATSSDEVTQHVAQLERLYDAEAEAERLSGALDGAGTGAMSDQPVPSADELAAEIERFLKGRAE